MENQDDFYTVSVWSLNGSGEALLPLIPSARLYRGWRYTLLSSVIYAIWNNRNLLSGLCQRLSDMLCSPSWPATGRCIICILQNTCRVVICMKAYESQKGQVIYTKVFAMYCICNYCYTIVLFVMQYTV